MPGVKEPSPTNRKRKLVDDKELEIDLSAPEPPSKKALRKAKKKSADKPAKDPAPVESNDDVQQPEKPAAKPATKPTTNQRTGFGVWIGNLQFSTTKEDVRTFLTTRGGFSKEQITRVHVPTTTDKRAGKVQNKGFAYVDFTTGDAVTQAIALSEQELNGRRVLIKDAKNYAGRPEKPADENGGSNRSKNPPARKIFIGNLSFDVTKEIIEGHFAPCGNVVMVHLATFEDSGKCKGFGFVEFETIEAAEAAMRGFVKVPDEDELDGSDAESSDGEKEGKAKKKVKKVKEKKKWVNRLMGRTLRMEFAEDATTRYEKRFGKNAKPKHEDNTKDGADDSTPAVQEVSEKESKPKRKDDSNRRPKSKPEVQSHSRYSKDTVQRLTGGIVEATGKKVTFD